MRYRRLGKTELSVSVIGFGAIKLPQVDTETAIEAIRRAVDLGINFIDTARGYGDSERKIGMAIKGLRERVIVATKTAARTADGAMRDLEMSLKELGTDYIDLYQLHSVSDQETYEQVMSGGGAYETLLKAKEKGLVRHIGVTMHRALETIKQAITSNCFETIMLAYSPLDQECVGREIIPLAHKHDMGIIIMKPLSGGQLRSRLNPLPSDPPERDEAVFESLRFIISNEMVSTVIPGMTCAREAIENAWVGEAPLPMTEEEKRRLMEAIGKLRRSYRYGQMCLRCGYCLPCAQGIRIPDVFLAYDMCYGYPENLRHMGIDLYMSLEVKPSECIECGECEERCPAGLPIRQRLREVMKELERAIAK
ncbi:MAG: aldo/keto reductase [Armatimonadota bacterium]|nr:aldo/keto reductase [Armatimonadota bacterium]MCX7778449.1 aldo/keto reductase [Armatimonadota bacterium]MDW8026037.1 aldo/keto reductase [Armatimonadota bacterium]